MLGGAIGAGFRYNLGRIALQNMGPGFPWGTWIANLMGGLLMGVLGGFTTFSAFSLESYNMILRGELLFAAAYAVSSVAGSILMLYCGVMLTRIFG
jgi:CrcB protein